MPGDLSIELWTAIFAIGILVIYLTYLFGSALLKAIWEDEEEQKNRKQSRDD